MYTEVSKHLALILSDAQRCDLPQGIRSKLITLLQFLHTQTLCDEDRRLPVAHRRTRWQEIETLLRGTNFFDRYRMNKSLWAAVLIFVGASVESPSGGSPPKESKWKKAEAADFFEFMARAAENKSALSETEILALRFGLYYLEAEAKRTRYQRDKSRIRFTWRFVQPLLSKANLLEPFQKEVDLVRRVKGFVSDTIL